MSRVPTTGAFSTREALEERVLGMFFLGATIPEIRAHCKVSRGCIMRIRIANSDKLSGLYCKVRLGNRKLCEHN